MPEISLKYKLSFFLILLTLLPTLTAGIFAYRVLVRALTENTQKSEMSILENQMTNFDIAMYNFELILNDLVTSESTQGFLQFRKEKESEIYYSDLLLLTSKLDSLINQHGDSLEMAAFLWNDGDLPLVRGNSSVLNLSGDYTRREPFSHFLQSDASIHWQVFQEQDGPAIYAYRTIYDAAANANIGVALINFLPDYFRELLARTVEQDAFCILLDGQGNIVYTAGVAASDALQLQEVIREDEDKKLSGGKGVVPLSLRDRKYMVSFADSKINGWRYLYFNPLTNINKSIHQITWLVLMVTVITAVLSVIAAMVLYHYLNSPITRLSNAMLHMEKGVLGTRVEIRRKDELGQLGDGFNQMSEKILELVQDIEKEQNEKRRAEIRFLQAQITPHFLYNTLNSIKSLARLKRTDDAAEMTTSLISLLRLVNSQDELITLTQEIEYVRNYVSIMAFRRNKKFILECDLEPGTEGCLLPKFSLQPFVENCIIHGFSTLEEEGKELKIFIHASIREELQIELEDNGKGFEPGKIIDKPEENGIRFSHVGIANVEERIRLYFGNQYGIQIDSAIGNGTRVLLTLPVKEKTEMP